MILPANLLPSQSDFVPGTRLCLAYLLHCGLAQHERNKADPMTSQEAQANQDVVGRPIHLNPVLSMQVLETDVKLLHVLSTRNTDIEAGSSTICGIQNLILNTWRYSGALCPHPVAVVSNAPQRDRDCKAVLCLCSAANHQAAAAAARGAVKTYQTACRNTFRARAVVAEPSAHGG